MHLLHPRLLVLLGKPVVVPDPVVDVVLLNPECLRRVGDRDPVGDQPQQLLPLLLGVPLEHERLLERLRHGSLMAQTTPFGPACRSAPAAAAARSSRASRRRAATSP